MLQTPQRYPRAGGQSYPTPAAVANPDGSTTVYFAPTKPAGVNNGNWFRPTDQGLEHAASPIQSTRTVLHKGVAAD